MTKQQLKEKTDRLRDLKQLDKVQNEVIRDRARKEKQDVKRLSKINKTIMSCNSIQRKTIIDSISQEVDGFIFS